MTAIVFLGPTLPVAEARTELDAIYLPPVAQGDIFRAMARRPTAIGIVDGFFDSVPAVWHKEILFAMSEGVHVYGCSSIGALRAAELWRYGMEGVGRIFEAYRDGILEDDDEVALIHAPAELDYAPLSEPMVNIRATLEQAEAGQSVTASTRTEIEKLAKGLYYADRTWPKLLALGAAANLPAPELDALAKLGTDGRVDQKRLDALSMLRMLRQRLADLTPKRVDFRFEHSWLSEKARQSANEAVANTSAFRGCDRCAGVDQPRPTGDALKPRHGPGAAACQDPAAEHFRR